MRKAVSLVSALLLAAWTLPAQAAIERTSLDEFNIAIWKVRAAFHSYSVMIGDPRFLEHLEDAIDDGADLVATLAESAESEEEVALMAELEPQWEEFEALANSNTVVELGYTDRYTVLDLDALAVAMHERLAPLRADISQPGRDLMELAVRIQRISSEYMAIAASPDGGGTVGTGEVRLEFNVAVPEFDQLLAKAQARYTSDEMVARSLDQVASKWSFMRESLIKFNENSVPFVVNRYTRSIVDNLGFTAGSVTSGPVTAPAVTQQ